MTQINARGPNRRSAGASGADSYESLTEKIDGLMVEGIPICEEGKTRIATLREQGDQLHRDRKAEASVDALKEVQKLIGMTEDAELYKKSEG